MSEFHTMADRATRKEDEAAHDKRRAALLRDVEQARARLGAAEQALAEAVGGGTTATVGGGPSAAPLALSGAISSVFDLLPLPLVVTNMDDGLVVYANTHVSEKLGIALTALIGQPAPDFYADPGDRSALLARVEAQGYVEGYELQIRRADGSVMDAVFSMRKVVFDGHPAVLSTFLDTTEVRFVEKELRTSRRLLQTVFDTIPHHLFVKDTAGNYLMVNSSMAETARFPIEELSERSTLDTGFGELAERQVFADSDRQVLATGQAVEVPEFTYTLPDGTQQLRRLYKMPLQDESGAIVGIVGISEDVTGARRAEEALKRSVAQARSLMEEASDGIIVTDSSGGLLYANAAFCVWTGRERAALLECNVSELLDAEQLASNPIPFQRLLAGETIVRERLLVAADGTRRPVESSARKLPDGSLQAIMRDISRRKQAETELSSSRQILQTIMDTVPHWLFVKDADARYLRVNAAMAQFYGFEQEAFVGKTLSELARGQDPKDLAESDNSDTTVLLENRPSEVLALRVSLADGSYAYRHVTKLPWRDQEGNAIGIVGISEDITQRMQDQAELRAGEERYRTLAEGSIQGILVHRREKALFVNESFARTFGYLEPAEILAMDNITTLAHPDSRDELRQMSIDRLAGKTVADHYEFRGLKQDGTPIWLEAGARLIDWEGEPAVQVVNVDVTERKEAAERLRMSRQQLAKAQEVAHMGSLDWDLVTNEQFWSDEVFRIIGVEPQSFTPNAEIFIASLHEEDRPAVLQAFQATLRDGAPFLVECRVVRPDKTERIVEGQGEVTRDADGRAVRMVGTVQDITERKNFERQLQQIQRMDALGTLAGGIAHDLNNILFPIIGYADMLLETELGEPHQTYMGIIASSAGRARDLVGQILLFSRAREGVKDVCQVPPIIREVVALIRSTLPATIIVSDEVDKAAAPVMANPSQLHQVVMNLCINASHAMPEGGRLDLLLENVHLNNHECLFGRRLSGYYVHFCCKDTGVGMTEEIMSHIFEPFYTTKGVDKGTGLGLSTVFGIVEQHDGALRLRSAPGQGSEFHVYLPAMEIESVERPQRLEQTPRGTESILYVDDEEAIVDVGKILLEALGYRVTGHTNSLEALEAFRGAPQSFDLMISDQTMPHMTGAKLASAVRAIRPELPIIICTGYSDVMSPEVAARMGINEFLNKPISPTNLGKIVRAVLDQDSK